MHRRLLVGVMTGVTLVMGAGGVGKTTVAAGLGARSAGAGTPTLVITVDPARRLAAALGIAAGAEPVAVSGMPGLWAAMLDSASAWEAIARRHADAATAARLVANPFFRAVADRFPSGQAYAAGEQLLHHAEGGRFGEIVVDTPPGDAGSAFLGAPRRIRALVAGRALRVLTGPRLPGRRMVYSLTARPALKVADTVLGGRLLEDVAEFLLDLSSIYPGLAQRSRRVEALYAAARTVVVATPDPGPAAEARRLLIEAAAPGRPPGRVVFNRVLPAEWAEAIAAPDATEDALRHWGAEARRQQDTIAAFATHSGLRPETLPWLVEPPVDAARLADLVAGIS